MALTQGPRSRMFDFNIMRQRAYNLCPDSVYMAYGIVVITMQQLVGALIRFATPAPSVPVSMLGNGCSSIKAVDAGPISTCHSPGSQTDGPT